jgi:hypothetical protein
MSSASAFTWERMLYSELMMRRISLLPLLAVQLREALLQPRFPSGGRLAWASSWQSMKASWLSFSSRASSPTFSITVPLPTASGVGHGAAGEHQPGAGRQLGVGFQQARKHLLHVGLHHRVEQSRVADGVCTRRSPCAPPAGGTGRGIRRSPSWACT